MEPRSGSHSSGGLSIGRVVGIRREVVDEVVRRVGVQDALIRLSRAVGGELPARSPLTSKLPPPRPAAERDQQAAVGRDRVDELDELQDRAQHREVVAAHRFEHVEHRHRSLADQLREVGDDRYLALDQLDDGHQRPGDLLDLLDDRAEEVADELARVEVERVEGDVELVEVEALGRVDDEAPVEVELPEHAGEAGALADVEPRAEAHVDVRLAGQLRREADVARQEVGDGDAVVARRQVELERETEGGRVLRVAPRDRRCSPGRCPCRGS